MRAFIFGTYLLLSVAWLISSVGYLVLGERVLRVVRKRYTVEWIARGKPSFITFAVIGEAWWRPISAGNFFGDREYRRLADAELTRRGDVVRILRRVAWSIPYGWVALAILAYWLP
jgi:hypothetical protein